MSANASYGGILRYGRLQRELSLRAAAQLVGCSHAHLADIEVGQRRPSPELARRLTEKLGAPPRSPIDIIMCGRLPYRPTYDQALEIAKVLSGGQDAT